MKGHHHFGKHHHHHQHHEMMGHFARHHGGGRYMNQGFDHRRGKMMRKIGKHHNHCMPDVCRNVKSELHLISKAFMMGMLVSEGNDKLWKRFAQMIMENESSDDEETTNENENTVGQGAPTNEGETSQSATA